MAIGAFQAEASPIPIVERSDIEAASMLRSIQRGSMVGLLAWPIWRSILEAALELNALLVLRIGSVVRFDVLSIG